MQRYDWLFVYSVDVHVLCVCVGGGGGEEASGIAKIVKLVGKHSCACADCAINIVHSH